MYISDGKTHLSYCLLCSSALSNEERKNIVRKFKSNQRKREIYNKYNGHYLQLERAKKKQRYSLMDGAKKEELFETCAKKYKEIDMSKKKQMLENRRKKYKEMDVSKKKQMLNRKAVKSRKRERSKLNVDVCIMESQIPLGPGKFHVVVLVVIDMSVALCSQGNVIVVIVQETLKKSTKKRASYCRSYHTRGVLYRCHLILHILFSCLILQNSLMS